LTAVAIVVDAGAGGGVIIEIGHVICIGVGRLAASVRRRLLLIQVTCQVVIQNERTACVMKVGRGRLWTATIRD
jgi:hypothetical protein